MNGEEGHGKQLMMLRLALPAPEIDLKEGWSVRSMRKGEGAVWARICRAVGFISPELADDGQSFGVLMGNDPGVRPENVFFVCDAEGKPAATATARLIPAQERGKYPPAAEGLGYLHYVAALPERRGMGAGAAATAAVLKRFEALDLGCCILATDDFRLPAIRLYLGMGWLPVLHAEDMRRRWERVFGELGITDAVSSVGMDGTPAAPILPNRSRHL